MGDMQRAMDRNYADNQNRNIEQLYATIQRLEAEIDEGREYAAGTLGVRSAGFTQLARYDPENPILKDKSLLERIKKAAISAFKTSGLDYNAAREVGSSFRIPGHEGPVSQPQLAPTVASPFARAVGAPAAAQRPSLSAVHSHPAHVELQQQYAGSLALRAALSEVVKQLDPDHPLLKDLYLQSSIRKAGITAFTLGKLDYDAARSAGVSFVLPKKAEGDVEKSGG